MKYALTLILVLTYAFIYGQFSSGKPIIQQFFPQELLLGDVDNDGDLDVISFCQFGCSGEIGWLENIRIGKFKQIQTFEHSNNFLNDLEIGDINQDGLLDIIVADQNLEVHYGIGNGLFGDAESLHPFFGDNLGISDLDGDGDLDITIRIDNDLLWLENLGTGMAADFQFISVSGPSYKIFDFDNDGDQDFLIESKIVENIGTGFEEYVTLPINFNGTFDNAVGDIDDDGFVDVVISSGDTIYVFKNENVIFSEVSKVVNTSTTETDALVSLHDLDNDGDMDIITNQGFTEGTKWHENIDNSNAFGEAIFLINETWSKSHFGDIDMDGDDDIIAFTGQQFYTGISWFEHENNVVDFQNRHHILKNISDIVSIDSGDFDGDNDIDLIIAATGSISNDVYWLENLDGTGNYGAVIELKNDDSVDTPHTVNAFDFDADGDMDIFAAYSQFGVRYYENLDGLASFSESNTVNEYSNDFVIFDDIDGDNDTDILSIHSEPYQILWLENSSGNYIEHIITDEIADYSQVVVEDYNNDGKMDILVYKDSDNSLAWYKNLDNSFSEKEIIDSDWASISDLKMADLDNDGLKDLVTSASFDELAWYKNSGNPTSLGEKQSVASLNTDMNIQLADFDSNGFIDFLFRGLSFDDLALYFNNGGVFDNSQVITTDGTSGALQFLETTDINNSGNQDIIVASSDELFWHENFFNYFQIQGTCFWDENENGNFDIDETPLNNQLVTLSPFSSYSWTNLSGEFVFGIFPGDYEINCEPSAHWEFTTNSSETITISDNSVTQNFGLKPSQIISEANLSISSAPTRCGFIVPFWLNYQNIGTTQNNGVITLELDDLVEFQSANPTPSQINGNTLTWEFTDLNPTYSNQIYIDLQMPGVMNIGEDIELSANILLTDDNGNDVFSIDYQYLSTINCAYDPNDKTANPPGQFTENLTLFDEEFEYTIRFQNTGTDTAFTVRLEDQLDTDLDWTTFHPITASHPYSVTLTDGGLVEFLFENILLPDSTTNEIASHGFAKYRIQPLNDLAENTEILNTANIFFDFNPPIQTNTTLNTMVSEITNTKEVLSVVKVDVSPNPFDEKIQFNIGKLPFVGQATLSILDVNGRALKQFAVSSNSTVSFDGKALPSGIYFYQLTMNGNNLHSGKLVKN